MILSIIFSVILLHGPNYEMEVKTEAREPIPTSAYYGVSSGKDVMLGRLADNDVPFWKYVRDGQDTKSWFGVTIKPNTPDDSLSWTHDTHVMVTDEYGEVHDAELVLTSGCEQGWVGCWPLLPRRYGNVPWEIVAVPIAGGDSVVGGVIGLPLDVKRIRNLYLTQGD